MTDARPTFHRRYTIEIPAAGAARVTVYRRGFPTPLTAVPAGDATVDLSLPAYGSIHVTATEDGGAIPVRVQVLPVSGTPERAPGVYGERAPTDGRVHVEFPEDGEVTMRVVGEVANARRAAGKQLEYLDFGGGFGIDYGSKPSEPPAAFVRAALALVDELGLADHELVIEPGRSLVAPYGVLVASVLQSKVSGSRRWVMIDAGMNDLIRPALYAAKHSGRNRVVLR